MNANLSGWMDFLVNQSLHLTVLFVVIGLLTLFARKRSAHLRYLLWLVVLVKCLVPPLVTVPMAVLPQAAKPTVVAAEPVVNNMAPTTVPSMSTTLPRAHVTQPVARDVAAATRPPAQPSSLPWFERIDRKQDLLWLWLAGTAFLLLVTLIRAGRFGRWVRRARQPLHESLVSDIEGWGNCFEPPMRVKVYTLDGISQPFVWGLWRGSIYVPANFQQTGSPGKRAAVLLHEMAHVRRMDPLVNLIQILVQAVYWFHPLVWFTNRFIRAEREKCCDEIAIAQLKTSPKDYGSAIVETLVQEYESRHAVPALAVAGPVKNLEDRIKTIMKPGKQFYNRPSFKALLVTLLLAIIAVPTTVALTHQTQRSKNLVNHKDQLDSRVKDYRVTLSHGLTIELLGVCKHPIKGQSWWRPDGTPLAEAPFDKCGGRVYPGDHEKAYDFALRFSHIPDGMNSIFRTEPSGSSIGGNLYSMVQKNGKDLYTYQEGHLVATISYFATVFNKDKTSCDLKVGIADGVWKTTFTTEIKEGSGTSSQTNYLGGVVFGKPMEQDGKTWIPVTDTLDKKDTDVRVVAVNRNGREFKAVRVRGGGVGTVTQNTSCFALPLKDIQSVRLQIRKYRWFTFKDVALRPETKDRSHTEKTMVRIEQTRGGQAEPNEPLTSRDRQQLKHLMQVLYQVYFMNERKRAEEIINFTSEQQKQRFIALSEQQNEMVGSSVDLDKEPIHIAQIELAGKGRVMVSALYPQNGFYIPISIVWVRTDQGWKLPEEYLNKELNHLEMVIHKVPHNEMLKRDIQQHLDKWQHAKGPVLQRLYDECRIKLQHEILMIQVARSENLNLAAGKDEARCQRDLDDLRAKTPEQYRDEMIGFYQRRLGPDKQYGKLEFRIAPASTESGRIMSDLTVKQEQQYRDALRQHGPNPVAKQDDYLWVLLRPGTVVVDLITQEFKEQTYLLVSNEPNEVMKPDGSWHLAAVYSQKDALGRPAISLEMDEAGGERMRQISRDNIKQHMAIVINGQVLSAPTIMTTIGKQVGITGSFTEDKVRDMVIALQKGMGVFGMH